MFFKFWLDFKSLIVSVSAIIIFLLSLISIFYNLLLNIWLSSSQILNYPEFANNLNSYKISSIFEIIFAFVSTFSLFFVFIFRMISKTFKKKCFANPKIILFATVLLFLSNILLVSTLYKEIYNHAAISINNPLSSDSKDFANAFNILQTGYIVKIALLVVTSAWACVYVFAVLVNDEKMVTWLAQDINQKSYRNNQRKKKHNDKNN